ncbi:unnamed protein product, partial [Closterium sp. Naga37s-1]
MCIPCDCSGAVMALVGTNGVARMDFLSSSPLFVTRMCTSFVVISGERVLVVQSSTILLESHPVASLFHSSHSLPPRSLASALLLPAALVSSKVAAQVCQEYSLAAVAKATNGWSEANLLGAGAYGDVYRTVSPTDGATPWAVKRAKVITNDFDIEVCEMATKHHPNLVRLLGFSIGITDRKKVEQILIYEFMPNGDLSRWIGKEAATPLSFEQRVGVLVGAARGFEYLHSF